MRFLFIFFMVFAASNLMARPTGEPTLDILLKSVTVNKSTAQKDILLTNWDCSICLIKIQSKN